MNSKQKLAGISARLEIVNEEQQKTSRMSIDGALHRAWGINAALGQGEQQRGHLLAKRWAITRNPQDYLGAIEAYESGLRYTRKAKPFGFNVQTQIIDSQIARIENAKSRLQQVYQYIM